MTDWQTPLIDATVDSAVGLLGKHKALCRRAYYRTNRRIATNKVASQKQVKITSHSSRVSPGSGRKKARHSRQAAGLMVA